MRYLELLPEDDEKPDDEGIDLPKELHDWIRSEHKSEMSLHDMWADFPFKRHLTDKRDWARVLAQGERRQLWSLESGRSEGSKIVVLDKRRSKDDNE
jgi:hypothetical protein